METNPLVVIADDHPLMRTALSQALGTSARVVEAETLDQAMRAVDRAGDQLDLVLVDLHMPGMGGFAGVVQLVAQSPSLPVVVCSASEGADIVRRARAYGASGFIPKSTPLPQLRQALGEILSGKRWFPETGPSDADDLDLNKRLQELTPQQLRVLLFIAQGLLNKQIAYELDISEATVKAHVTAILRKLNCHSRTQAALIIERLSLSDPATNVADPMPDVTVAAD